MSNLIAEARKALVARLETITLANSYYTDAGSNVLTGWLNEILKTDDANFPLIAVQQAKGSPPSPSPGTIVLHSSFDVIGAVDAGLHGYEDALDDMQLDLLHALIPPQGRPLDWMPKGVAGVSIGAPELYPPANGERASIVRVPVTLKIMLRMKD